MLRLRYVCSTYIAASIEAVLLVKFVLVKLIVLHVGTHLKSLLSAYTAPPISATLLVNVLSS